MTATGPVFDGRAAIAAAEAVVTLRRAVVSAGEKVVRDNLSSDIRNNVTGRAPASVTSTSSSIEYRTGRYSMPVLVANPLSDTVITTSLATYGPWLEGTGSRNQSTRFKGYSSFRRSTPKIQALVPGLADTVLAAYEVRMN